jgi:signal peptidase complex subunit 3
MFNLVTRFQTAANQALSSALILAGAIVIVTLLQLYQDQAWWIDTTSISNIKPVASLKYSFNYGSVNRKPKENSKIVFDLDADLTPLFNWNTKQVFVYLTAEYEGKSDGSSNKITYWDKIITSKDQAKLHLTNQHSKYSVWDIEKSFRNRNATVKLEWNIQPHVGPLIFGETGEVGHFVYADVPVKKSSQ